MRRPTPSGAGAPCRNKLIWARIMMDGRLDAFRKRGLELPAAIITADSWFSGSKLMTYIRDQHQGPLWVEGKVSYTFALADGRHINGHDFREGEWAWRRHPWEPGVRYVRLQAQSPTYGVVTVVIVDEAGPDRFYLLGLETTLSGPVLTRRWRRRHWIEFVFRVLKHLLATESCQAKATDAYASSLSFGELPLLDSLHNFLTAPSEEILGTLTPIQDVIDLISKTGCASSCSCSRSTTI